MTTSRESEREEVALSPKQRSRFVALSSLLRRRFPEVHEPEKLIAEGQVLVDGAPVSSPRAFVRADAAIKIVRPKPLRGTAKLAHAIERFGLDVSGLVAVDLGAAAGGFTKALLDAGAARVYAVDAGFGQLRGFLRADRRVVNLEGTNLGRLSDELIAENVDLVTMDLSYLAVSEAVPQLDRLRLSSGAHLIALVKPTFELHASRLAVQPEQVVAAADAAGRALDEAGWQVAGRVQSPVRGSHGAVEVLLHATRCAGDFKATS
ncbi:MAG TPA: SAM-dependent methyltransferase [Acidimicrobiales bacterium]|nr:SAM-dependent methyltransferase [Acidimicrobiales bacterium]